MHDGAASMSKRTSILQAAILNEVGSSNAFKIVQ